MIVGIAIGVGATLVITKAVQPVIPPCPSLTCPPATEVNLQTLDLDALKRIKGDFVYSPSLSNVSIKIEAKDSLLLKELFKSVK